MTTRRINFLFALLLFTAVSLTAQTQESPAAEPKKEPPVKKEEKKEFQDLNANGIDDAKEFQRQNGQQKKMRSRDKFIDADGDGICDGRAGGAGLKLRPHGNASGKQSQKGKR